MTPSAPDPESTETTPRAVAFVMLKGGFGKTPLARELADRLAKRDHRVLLIDTDPEGHLSTSFGYVDRKVSGPDLGDVLVDGRPPAAVIRETDWGFDIVPAHNLERVKSQLNSLSTASDLRMRQELVDPLLGTEYDYVLVDTPGSNNELVTNAVVAARNIILPLRANAQAGSGLRGVMQKLVGPLRRYGMDVDVLAATPTALQNRIDQDTADRRLLQSINTSPTFAAYLMAGIDGADPETGTLPEGVTVDDVADVHVPPYARITEEQWEQIDAGELRLLPELRKDVELDSAFARKVPLSEYNPNNDRLEALDELAAIIERGGVRHD